MIGPILLLLWLGLGCSGFIYWWTSEFDLDLGSLIFSLMMSWGGPVTWLVGYLIHGGTFDSSQRRSPIVLMKQRKR